MRPVHTATPRMIAPHTRHSQVTSIEFNTTVAAFDGGDSLRFYTSRAELDNNNPVGRFDATHAVPPLMILTGSREALLRLDATVVTTRLRVHWSCRRRRGMLSLRISPTWLTLWLGVWTVCVCMCCVSTCWLLRQRRQAARLRRRSDQLRGSMGDLTLGNDRRSDRLAFDSVGRTVLLVHAELMRRREAEGRAAREATEARATCALQSLPSRRWSQAGAAAGGLEEGGEAGAEAECCLCIEVFVPEDQVRLLPCGHYFHAACIDRWFSARAYQQRTCPLCKADPLAMLMGHGVEDADGPEDITEEVIAADAAVRAAAASPASPGSLEATALGETAGGGVADASSERGGGRDASVREEGVELSEIHSGGEQVEAGVLRAEQQAASGGGERGGRMEA